MLTKYRYVFGESLNPDSEIAIRAALLERADYSLWNSDPYQASFMLFDLAIDDQIPKPHQFIDQSIEFMVKWADTPNEARTPLSDTIRTLITWVRGWWATLDSKEKELHREGIAEILTRRSASACRERAYLIEFSQKLKKERDELYGKLHKGIYVTPSFKGRFSPADIKNNQVAIFGPYTHRWLDEQLPFYRDKLAELGLSPVLAKNMTGEEIVEDIWQLAVTSELCLVDLTGFNYNVFYELGICHTLGKHTIIVIEKEGEESLRLPFNIQSRRVLAYSLHSYRGQREFTEELSRLINALIDRPSMQSETTNKTNELA